jgi:hypothetical protein
MSAEKPTICYRFAAIFVWLIRPIQLPNPTIVADNGNGRFICISQSAARSLAGGEEGNRLKKKMLQPNLSVRQTSRVHCG